MSIVRKRKIQVDEKTKTNGVEQVKLGKIQRFSSSSESESDDEISKSKINSVTQTIERKSSSNKFDNVTEKKGLSKKRNLDSDSDEPPLVIDEDQDLKGSQVDKEKHLKSCLDPVNSNLNCSVSGCESSSEDDLSQKENEERSNDKDVKIKKKVIKDSSTSESESSEPDVQGTQERKGVQTKSDVSKKLNIITSESDHEERQETANLITDIKTKSFNKKSDVFTSESESDPEERQTNKCSLPKLNNDIQIQLREVEQKNDSDGSNFELSLENDSSHDKKELQSSNAGKSKASNDARKNKSANKKEGVTLIKNISTPVTKVDRDLMIKNRLGEVSSDDSAEEEDLNEAPVNFKHETYRPTQEERTKLLGMSVMVRHPILPQHKIESTAGTRTLKDREREEFENYVVLKHGKFSNAEDIIIKRNWKTFCQDNEWDPKNPKPFLFMQHKNRVFLMNKINRKRFMQCLAHDLPDRCLYSVFQRFKILFEPHRTCRYASEEDEIIWDFMKSSEKKAAVNEKDRKFAELAIILRRTRASVWRRYRVLRKKAGKENKDKFCQSSK